MDCFGWKLLWTYNCGEPFRVSALAILQAIRCFVKNKRILSTGYNGAPSGLDHCDVVGCARENVASGTHHELCRAVHAEQNAIIQAALHGISIEGATLYCTHQPCILCAKMMINARVIKVVYQQSYPDGTALDFLEQAGIDVERVKAKTESIERKRLYE